jgi:hypothetical protein
MQNMGQSELGAWSWELGTRRLPLGSRFLAPSS